VWRNPVEEQSKDRRKISPQDVESGKCLSSTVCKPFNPTIVCNKLQLHISVLGKKPCYVLDEWDDYGF
jgi:hypothetical protein